jgi:hypothetical protein
MARICDFPEDSKFPIALYYYLCECESFEYQPEAQQLLLKDHSITRLDQVEEVMMCLVEPEIAIAFFQEAGTE